MTIPPELEARILRYYHVEKWRVGTLSAQLGVHHSTVSRVLAYPVEHRLLMLIYRLFWKPWKNSQRSQPPDCMA